MLQSRKLALLYACAATFLLSCNKTTDSNRCNIVTTAAPAAEVSALQAALSVNGIVPTGVDTRGFFYTIARNGDTAKHPTVCSSLKVSYTLRMLNGTQVEAGNNASFTLSNLILGWQEGVPLIGKGGYITLYLPPSLAYGASGSGNVPANANLIFQIDLVDVL